MGVSLFNNRSSYQHLEAEIAERIQRVIESGRFILGPEVDAFESEFAAHLGVKHVVGVANGTDAITIALMAMGIGSGDEVVVPSFTFFATAEAVCHAGATPVFCDVDPETYLMTAESSSKSITDRTCALIPVHLLGNVAPMDELMELAEERNISVIEDTAQATGATLMNRKAGSIGSAGTFSFFPSKNLPCFGDGGAIATNSEDVASEAKLLRLRGSRDKRSFFKVGLNSRLDAIQAAVLRTMLPELDGWNDQRRGVANTYFEHHIEQYQVPQRTTNGAEHAYNLFVTKCEGRDRDDLIEKMNENGIETRSMYATPVHRQPAMKQYSEHVDLPVTDHLAESSLALPMGPDLDNESVGQVVEALT